MSIDLILLSLSLLTWGIGEGMFFIFLPLYLQQLGANPFAIGVVFFFFGLAMAIPHIPAGYLADRIGRKPLLVTAWITGAVSTLVMALAQVLPVFIAGMLLYGATAFVSSPMNSYITAARGKLSPVRAMTLLSAAYNLGAILGPISGGWIGERLSLHSVYLVSACIFVVSTFMVFFLHPQPRELHDPAALPDRPWKNPRFVGFLGIIFLAMFVMYLPQPLTPSFLQNERGLSLERIGLLGSIGSLGNTLLALLLGQFAARSGFLVTQVLVAAFCLLLWKGSGLGWFALGYFLLGGFRSARSLIYAQISPLIHATQMGLAYGVAETFSAMAIMLAPLLAGALYTYNPGLVYPVSICLILVVVVLSWIFSPRQTASSNQTMLITPPEI